MKHLTNSEDRRTLRSALAIEHDSDARELAALNTEFDKYLRPAHLVAFEMGDHAGPQFSERALEKIAKDVAAEPQEKPADSMVGRLFRWGVHTMRVRSQMQYSYRADSTTGNLCSIVFFPGDFGRFEAGYRCEWLPAHATLIPHDRPLFWLTRLDIEKMGRARFHITHEDVCCFNKMQFDGECGGDGSQLADYLPEA